MVDVVYKDEPNVIYTYRYQRISDTNEKGVLSYYERVLNKDVDPDTYPYKHKHEGE